MTTEEKARKYDEALEIARKCLDEKRDTCFVRPDVIFPELAESEDVKIRKDLIKWFKEFPDKIWGGHYKNDILNWLEKQGDQKLNPYTGTSFEYNGHIWGMCARDNGVDILCDRDIIGHLEKQGEQKPIDEAKSKFKIGDWITFYGSKPFKILKVEPEQNGILDYLLLEPIGHVTYYNKKYVDENARLWTIQDAKLGDVIYLPNGNNEYYLFIFKGIENAAIMSFAHFYHQYNDGTSEVEGTIDNLFSVNDVFQPSTKEQCDLLFSKMKEAGYEWNAENKKLIQLEKQDEQKSIDKVEPKFKVGDWIINRTDATIMQIVNNKDFYESVEISGQRRTDTYNYVEWHFKLWTIQDAKTGDVLVERKKDVILMFRGIGNSEWDDVIDYHCYYDCYHKDFIVQEDVEYWGNTENNQLVPAIEEQRDILFQKIREAGYEWDTENKELIQLKKQGEQKSIDNVELKFKVGDWIVYKNDICQIVKREDGCNKLVTTFGIEKELINERNLSTARLWTIEDAKDGDVLLSKHNQPFIYNGIFDEDSVGAYCGIDCLGDEFLKDIFSCNWSYKEGVKPATKEQRDLLFQKMKEAGYEWDANKKELKKFHVIDEGKAEMDYCFTKMMNGEKVSSAWSEEDEKIIRRIDSLLYAIHESEFEDIHAWIKSLKDRVQPQNRWKPSKEQIIALRWILNNIPYNKHKEEISGLLDQIKVL